METIAVKLPESVEEDELVRLPANYLISTYDYSGSIALLI